MAAPSLETLSFLTYIPELNSNLDRDGVVWKEDLRAAAIFCRDYPSMRHLTLRLTGLFDWDDDEDKPTHPLHYGLHFPAVAHLHTAIFRHEASPSLTSHLHYFRNLTHQRISAITSLYQLPSDLIHITYRNPEMADRFKEQVLGIQYRYSVPPQPIPRNLTVIVQPGFDPMFGSSWGWCGTPGVEYDQIFRTLANRSQVYVELPIEEDHRKYDSPRGIVPLRQAIAEFVDLVQGGDGDWAIPEPAGEETWWWNRASESGTRDETEL
ncbi:hypothetical protein C8R45DRAFT_1100546 [Mycena sanguinolenta]|nr:hypothetical protein C8R45DRAFT_1100546 [Mycena sanguinolenta]